MIALAKSIGSIVSKGIRFIKMTRYGRGDHSEVVQINPFGIESNPVKNIKGVYAKTINDNVNLNLGFICKSTKTEEGETMIYATDQEGNIVFEIILKNTGEVHFNGSNDFLVKWTALNSANQSLILGINGELAKIATAINSIVPGAYVVAPVSIDLSSAKAAKLKTT